jgi:GT2 family glycosyltransferase
MDGERILVLTPVKQAARHLDRYFGCLERLTHPAELTSLGFLEGDSTDGSYDLLAERLPALRERYRRVTLDRHDFGLSSLQGADRWATPFQLPRRIVLAKCRNRLLFSALDDEDWVLWLDVDVVEYPPDVVEQMLATGKDIVTPHCVTKYGGGTFDWNAWRDQGTVRMDSLRGGPDVVRLDAVGATMLLVRADVHREGLIFPPYLYGRESRFARNPSPLAGHGVGEVETEGLGLMAKDMGFECWGMPNLEILHMNE